jgi:hypothetical protein
MVEMWMLEGTQGVLWGRTELLYIQEFHAPPGMRAKPVGRNFGCWFAAADRFQATRKTPDFQGLSNSSLAFVRLGNAAAAPGLCRRGAEKWSDSFLIQIDG